MENLYSKWDTCDITENQVQYLMEEEGLSEEKARDRVYHDYDLLHWEWQDFTEDLTNLMKELNKGAQWRCELSNFGWRDMDGHKEFEAGTGQELLSAILPNTDCTFSVYREDDHFWINNAHHDKPTGGEIYRLYPVQ